MSLSVVDGCIIGLFGVNGVGKMMMLCMLVGFFLFDVGYIVCDGIVVKD